MILVLDNGEAREIGNHAELMKQNGIYREMFEQQQLEALQGEISDSFSIQNDTFDRPFSRKE